MIRVIRTEKKYSVYLRVSPCSLKSKNSRQTRQSRHKICEIDLYLLTLRGIFRCALNFADKTKKKKEGRIIRGVIDYIYINIPL